jgi:hypothetical protein
MKPIIIFLCFLLISATNLLVRHAEANSDTWSQDWHNWVNYYDAPVSLSTTTICSGANGHCVTEVALVVSIYRYDYVYPTDYVQFVVAVYVKAIADSGYQPQYATDVSIQLDKIGSDQGHTLIHMINNEDPPGYSQSYGLNQGTNTSSSYESRALWVLSALGFAVGLFSEPIGIAVGLIDVAVAFVPSGVDYQNAGYADSYACSWWHSGYYWSESPVRQYCFNSFRWKQDPVQPSAAYGPNYDLKIWATVSFQNQYIMQPITTSPIYLHIIAPQGGGGGGLCPTLFAWSGTDYVQEGLLGIHADSDITVKRRIQNSLTLENGVYKLQLRELDEYTSHIDQVKLYAVDYKGEWHSCPLTYAYHSELGRITWKLLFDDENKANLEPTQVIDLKFLRSIPYSRTAYFIFEINGYNRKTEE